MYVISVWHGYRPCAHSRYYGHGLDGKSAVSRPWVLDRWHRCWRWLRQYPRKPCWPSWYDFHVPRFVETHDADVRTGDPRGLQGSHNWIESDSSLTRDDLYVTGDAWSMNMTLFRDFYDRADEDGVISMDLLAEQAARRWNYSVSHNPNFYYGPVTGMISRNAGYLFLGRLLSNHTKENPDGVLTQEVFKSFFAVYEDAQGNLEYRKGHETFPSNWYRRQIDYGLLSVNLDIVGWVSKYPELGRYVELYSFSLLGQVTLTTNTP